MLLGARVGLLIGKSGEMIKQVQNTDVKLVIMKDTGQEAPAEDLRNTGEPSNIDYAKQLIFELAESHAPDNVGFGGGKVGHMNNFASGGPHLNSLPHHDVFQPAMPFPLKTINQLSEFCTGVVYSSSYLTRDLVEHMVASSFNSDFKGVVLEALQYLISPELIRQVCMSGSAGRQSLKKIDVQGRLRRVLLAVVKGCLGEVPIQALKTVLKRRELSKQQKVYRRLKFKSGDAPGSPPSLASIATPEKCDLPTAVECVVSDFLRSATQWKWKGKHSSIAPAESSGAAYPAIASKLTVLDRCNKMDRRRSGKISVSLWYRPSSFHILYVSFA